MRHDNEEWCKFLGGIYLSFQIWHEEFDKLGLEHSEVSKICTLMGSFCNVWTKTVQVVMFDNTED